MSSNFTNNAPFLRQSRFFPPDSSENLSREVDRSYLDIANAVNNRTISIFSSSKPTVNGESWYTSGSNARQQAFRQVYTFTAAGTIVHNINTSQIAGFVRVYGTFTDGTVWYPLPYVSETGVTNQVSITVDATNINITAGAGSPPSITSGFVVLEWIVNT